MKNTINTKKVLKATIAFSGVLLFGCAPVSENGVDYYEQDTQVVNYEPAEGEIAESDITIDDSVLFDEDGAIILTDDQIPDKTMVSEEETLTNDGVVIVSQEEVSVAASTPDEPHVVPAKEDEKCPTCKKKETASADATAATPTATGVGVVVGGGVVAGAKSENTETAEQGADLPVVEKTVENGADIVVLDEGDNFVILDKTVDGSVVTDIQEVDENGDKVTRIQKTVDIQEDTWEDDEEARLRAERARLQGELENLTAEKKALEDEKTRITQIQQANTEACDEVKDWVAAEGTTLRTLLMDWGDRVGWRVIWNMDRDYTLEAGAIFRGRFVDVAAALLRSFARAVPAPKGVFYKGNKVLVVSTREDENAD